MRIVVWILLTLCSPMLCLASTARAQVINGESTDDAGYAHRPAARWTPPSGQPEPSAIDPDPDQDDRRDSGGRDDDPTRSRTQ